jgi:hypothetical protein
MPTPGYVTGYTNVKHVRGLIEIMPVGKSAAAYRGPVHVTVATGTMTVRTIVVITFNLVCG